MTNNKKILKTFLKVVAKEINFFLSFFSEFSEKVSLHGLGFVFNSYLNIFERLLWLILILMTSYGAYNISSTQYERYVANPTVISLERDYREWNGTLPAVTLCYHKRINDTRAEAVIKRFWNTDRDSGEYEYFYEYIKTVVYFEQTFEKFEKYTNDRRLNSVSMLTIAKLVHPSFNSIVTSFDTNAEFSLNEVVTEKGLCYTVNSVLWPLISTNSSNHRQLNLKIRPLSCYFLKNQCYMKLDVYDPTVFIAIHSPFELPVENTPFFDMGMTDEIESSYNMLETVASSELKKLRIAQRNCYFIDESTENLPVYSYNACKLVCRAKAAIRFCGCRPYFYPFMNETVCSPSGLFCLTQNNWPNAVTCDCSKTCVEIVYTQNSLKKINW
ncbi:hypothetical protein PVAND_017562 [Polypedilum vanderplanki]|uniref:Uncharacterized protein n=1 Tax=Polypedilum vanderplanki TaxID=319348 RepID=A0A9J6BJD9_POLVA|nr:hypothetical protein PVAND_017562 [Polypedilum vanderplanki]